MALVRCPQCGRVAEPPSCFACGHTWDDDGSAGASAPAPAAPAPVSDPVSDVGDLFGAGAPAPDPNPFGAMRGPPTPPPMTDAVDVGALDEQVRASGIDFSSLDGTAAPDAGGIDFGALGAPTEPPPAADGIDFGSLSSASPPAPPSGDIDFGDFGAAQPPPPPPDDLPGVDIDFGSFGDPGNAAGGQPLDFGAGFPASATASMPAPPAPPPPVENAPGADFGIDFGSLGGSAPVPAAPSTPEATVAVDLDDLPAETRARAGGDAVGQSPNAAAFEARTVAFNMDALPAEAVADVIGGPAAPAPMAPTEPPPPELNDPFFGAPGVPAEPPPPAAQGGFGGMPISGHAPANLDPDRTEAFAPPSSQPPQRAFRPPDPDATEEFVPPPPDFNALGGLPPAAPQPAAVPEPPSFDFGFESDVPAPPAMPEEPPAPPSEATVDFPEVARDEPSDEFELPEVPSLDDLPDVGGLDDLPPIDEESGAVPAQPDLAAGLALPEVAEEEDPLAALDDLPSGDDFLSGDDDDPLAGLDDPTESFDGDSLDEDSLSLDLPESAPPSREANPTLMAPIGDPATAMARYDVEKAKRLSGEMEKVAELLESEGKIGEAALLYEVQAFLESLF